MTSNARIAPRKTGEFKFITFIICILLIGAIIGGFIVGAFNTTDKAQRTTRPIEPPYGTRDGKYVTENGGLTFDYENGGGFTPLECALSEDLQEFTYYLCDAYYIDFEFAMAVMFTESSFNTDVISSSNDFGLMQINECNHTELAAALGVTDFTEPYQNIRAGLYILRRLFEKYDEPELVCMAYNMGEYGASVLWDKGVYETSYSQKVLVKAEEYRAQRGGAADE